MDTIEGLDGIKQAVDKANALAGVLGLVIDSEDKDSRLIIEIIADQLDEIKDLAENAIRRDREPAKVEALDRAALSSADNHHMLLVK